MSESWRERAQRREQVSREARLLDPEPVAPMPRLVLAAATAAWLLTLVWLVLVLPERVPTHWSGGGVPDGWSSRTGALAFSLLVPLLTLYPMLWLSRLVIVWPDGVNTPHKEWWLDTPRRLRRFERLFREDLMLIIAVTVLLFAGTQLTIGYAAHQPGGELPWWVLPVMLVPYVALLALVVARMAVGSRYRPDESDPDLR